MGRGRSLILIAVVLGGVGCERAQQPQPSVNTTADASSSVVVLAADAIEPQGNSASYINRDGGVEVRISFPLPADRVDAAYLHDVERIGRTGDTVAVVDSYGSRPQDSRCRDGREAWLRIFSLARRQQVEAILVESCRDRLVPGNPAVTWQGDGFTIGGTKPRAFRIEPGRVRLNQRN